MSAFPPDRRQRAFSRAALTLSFSVIALITVGPSDQPSSGGGWACIYCSTFALADAILNVVLFVPLGIGMRCVRMTATRAVAVGLLTSIAIESAQLFVIPGRDASIGDILSNTVGTGLGYLIATNATAWLFPGFRLASHISLVYSWLLLGIVCGTTLLFKPSFTAAVYFGDWTPNPGRVIDVSIGSLNLPPRRLEHSDSVRTSWLAGAPLKIGRVAGPTTQELESLFSIHDENHREILLVGRDGDDLVYWYRMRASGMRLHQPLLRLPRAMEGIAEGDSITVNVRRVGQQHCMKLNETDYCGLGFTAGTSWALLISSVSLPKPFTALPNAVWLAGLLVPLGLWARSNATGLISAFLALVALGLVPQWAGFLPTPPFEWAGAGIGIGFGFLLRLGFRRLHPPSTDSDDRRGTDVK